MIIDRIIDKLIGWLITWLSDWLIPLPSDSLGNEICKFSHVKDHADRRGSGHENGEDGFLGGAWDETVHQVGTRPLVTLHQPWHLETVVHHVQGIPVGTETRDLWRRGMVTPHQQYGRPGRKSESYMKPPSNSSLKTRLQAYVHQRAPAIGSRRLFRVSSSSSWPLLLRKPALPEPCLAQDDITWHDKIKLDTTW